MPPFGTNARDSGGEYFVVEADEYDYSFLQLEPDVAIVTNIEHDHPDLFPDFERVLDAFHDFTKRIRPGGALVISADDAGCRRLLDRLDASVNFSVVTFGTGSADWTTRRRFGASEPTGQMFELPLSVPGRHNRFNALAVLASRLKAWNRCRDANRRAVKL